MDLKNMTRNEKMDLADNLDTPVGVLRKLANDEDFAVRTYVAENPNTPEDILLELVQDIHSNVRYFLTKNPKASRKIIVSLFEHEKRLNYPDSDVINRLYNHRKLPHIAKVIIETLFGKMLV